VFLCPPSLGRAIRDHQRNPAHTDRCTVIALILGGLGLAAVLLAALLLRSVGPGYRVARLLAAAPEISLAEALAMARQGKARYVRVAGRISSEEEFPDEHDRPLVYRRRRVEVALGSGRWRVLREDREAVPFGLGLRSDYLALDGDALEEGLVVIAREALGRAEDLPPELAASLDPGTPVRLTVEQVSAVEHAIAAGMPRTTAGVERQAGAPEAVLGAGLGRPLILSTLEVPAAMRVLARGRRRRVVAAAALLVCGLGLLGAAAVALVASG
jgi:hypothetical protein